MAKSNKTTNKKIAKKVESMACLGQCQCGGPLIISTLAPKSERFTVTCVDCGSVSDVRFPKRGDLYTLDGTMDDNPLKLLCRYYESENVIISDDEIATTPVSKLVNEKHGSL